MTINITSANRTAAKRLLNNWHDSRDVRTWTLERLNFALQRAINEGLITEAGAARALLPHSERNDNGQHDGGGEYDGKRDHENDDERDQYGESHGEGGKGDDGDGDGEDGDGDGDESKDGDSEQDSEYNDGDGSKDGDGEDDGEESDGDDGAESQGDDGQGDDGESESDSDDEQDGEQDGEQEQDDESNDDTPLRHYMFKDVLAWISAGVNVALVGPAGTGKSTIVAHCAQELQREFRGTGALMSKYDLVGYKDANGVYHSTPLYEAFTEGHLFCFDELDGSAPDAVVAFNAATDNQNVFAFPNGMQPKHADFVAVACMNTWGNGASADYVGRYKQDAASMSRFVRVFIDYDRKIERAIAGKHVDIAQRVWDLRDSCEELGIRHVVSTRMIQQCVAGRMQKISKAKLDRDVLFSGLDDGAVKQLKSAMNAKKAARANGGA